MEMHLGRLVDIENRKIKPVCLVMDEGRIESIEELPDDRGCSSYLIPGFVDSHIHIESSMLTPAQFARAAVVHGTVGSVSDPHEIANVLGEAGVDFMLENAAQVRFKFCFGAPSCVPATVFETSGASLDLAATERLLDDPRIGYLAEMMNFPGVLSRSPDVMAKIAAAQARGKPIDGHAPGMSGDDVGHYFTAGMSTDHECSTLEEALEKLAAGVFVQIREGSAARNFDALISLIDQYPTRVMFCSDDKHPDELLIGHINQLCARAIAAGCDLFNVLRAACLNPVAHYRLPIGQLRVGDPADFVELSSLESFSVMRTYLDGVCVAENGQPYMEVQSSGQPNQFRCSLKATAQFAVPRQSTRQMRVVVANDRLLTTTSENCDPPHRNGVIVADPSSDLLKLTVVNRYAEASPSIAFVRSFGLTRGAIAGSVGHDSHNIIAVGATDEAICTAVNCVIQHRGGLVAVDGDRVEVLPLPIAGLMSDDSCEVVADRYSELDRMAKELGSSLQSPFMTLSFLALLVIPSLKLSDLGLFDAERFELVDLFV